MFGMTGREGIGTAVSLGKDFVFRQSSCRKLEDESDDREFVSVLSSTARHHGEE
jgi:hypothetical protein